MKTWLIIFWLLPLVANAQNKYGLTAMKLDEYRKSVEADPLNELVNLSDFIPGIVLDIRYATTNNFTKEKIYNLPRAYARRPVAEALKKIQADLKMQGLGLKIFDARLVCLQLIRPSQTTQSKSIECVTTKWSARKFSGRWISQKRSEPPEARRKPPTGQAG